MSDRYELRTEVHFLEASDEAATGNRSRQFVSRAGCYALNPSDLAALARTAADEVLAEGWEVTADWDDPSDSMVFYSKRIPPHRILTVFVTVHLKEGES